MGKQRVFTKRDRSRRVGTVLTRRLLFSIYSHYGSDIAKRAKSLLLRGKWDELCALSVDPRDYSDAKRFSIDYLLCELASKVPPVTTGATPESLAKAALDKFQESEVQCADTNQRLPAIDSTVFRNLYGHSVREVFCLARDKIHQLLGDFSWDECQPLFGFGPGASTRLNRSRSDLYYKFGPKPDTTHLNLALAGAAAGFNSEELHAQLKECGSRGLSDNLWARQLTDAVRPGLSPDDEYHFQGFSFELAFNIVDGNKITTVPKNSKTDRTIAIEPCMNMYIQKGIGAVIRRRLGKVGIDLSDQSINQLLAKQGSIDGSLATIDLKSASDTVATRLVSELLPPDWYRAMNMTRSHCGVLPSGALIWYHKFSSMGNGFTFELESLIFWALSKAVADYLRLKDRRLGIYGDDLIIPTRGAQLLLDVLKVAGFTPNDKKSFVDGPFRESCGKHYFRGIDVTPFYLRKEVDHAQPLFVAVNNLRRWIHRKDGDWLSNDSWSLYSKWFHLVPRKWRKYRGPDGYGDGFLIGNFEECWPHKARYGVEGWEVQSLVLLANAPSRKSGRVEGPSLLPKSFYRLEKKMLEDGEIPSDELTTRLDSPMYKEVKHFLVRQWPMLGYNLT